MEDYLATVGSVVERGIKEKEKKYNNANYIRTKKQNTMLQLKTVVDEMNGLIEERQKNYSGPLTSKEKKELVRMRKRIQYLKVIRLYLEKSPTIDFIKKEIDRIENRINLIDSHFSHSEQADEFLVKQLKKEYDKENGIPQLRIQLRALRFIKK